MQAPTHILVGILLSDLFHKVFPNLPFWIFLFILIPIVFSSHFLIDAAAIFTYHPPKADWKDKTWVSYHLGIYILTLVLLILFWQNYWWIMLAATAVDLIDWILLRGILKKDPRLHPIADVLRTHLFPQVKNLNHTKWTILLEIILMGILGGLIWII